MSNTVAKFYKDTETFTCISNPSIKLDIARLNDDYCDCPDGSDEPGTSACSYISPLSPPRPSRREPGSFDETLALPGFYCKNKGHVPSYIPFTNVNDGKCDYELCCDGSDEYEGVGGVKCPDQCASIGKEWRKQDEARQKSLANARQKRKELVAESGRLRKEVEDRITTLKTQIEGQTQKVDALTKSLAEIERAEKGKVVRGAGKGGKVTVLASLAKERIQELTDNVERVRQERDAAKGRIDELEAMLKRFKEEYNPNFNDEGVKRAVKAWEDYAAQDWPAPDAARDRDLDEILKPDSESAIKWDEFDTVEESDVDVRKYTLTQPSLEQPLTCFSLPIRKLPPRVCPRLGRPEAARPPHHPHRERHPRLPTHRWRRVQSRHRREVATRQRHTRAQRRQIRADKARRRPDQRLRPRFHLPRAERPLCVSGQRRVYVRALLPEQDDAEE